MNRFALLACTSVAALSLDGCLLNWNQFRPSDAAADVASRPDAEDPDTGVVVDSGVLVDTGVRVDTGVDTGVVLDTGVDTGVLVDTGVPVDARADAAIDARPDAAPDVVVGDADPGCTGPVVINEVQTYGAGGGTDEFVELLNTGTCEVSLSGWQISYRSSSGASASTIHRFTATDSLRPGNYFVAGGSGYMVGAMIPRLISGVADASSVALLDPMGRVVDSVAFGSVTLPHPYAEPNAGPAATHRAMVVMSVGRVPNGQDTNNNAADFRDGTPSPGAPNP